MNGNNSTFFFIGGGLPYANSDTEIITTNDCVSCDNSIWDSMIAAKKVYPNEVELILDKKVWTSGRIYRDFDDTISLETLNNDDSANNIYAMFIINSENNVYKCLSNNHGNISTDEPLGNYTISNGFIETTDGYIWKYLFNIKDTNKFLTSTKIPVPFYANTYASDIEYNMNIDYILPGTINKIEVEYPGSGYIDSEITVSTFAKGATYLQASSLTNIVPNMGLSGTGIATGTYITSISTEYNRIYLSVPTISSGGSSANTIQIKTRIVISGDGLGCEATATILDTEIDSIDITTMGSDYTYANIDIYGTGTEAAARAILPPKYGHGISPAIELSSKALMITKVFGEIDSTEDGIIPVDIKFRQYGITINPRKYGSSEIITYDDSPDVLSQVMELTLEAGSLYTAGEYVYQGSSSEPSFYGYILSQDYYTVKIVNFYGEPIIGTLLTNGAISRPVTNFSTPILEKYSGDILYIKNISPIERVSNQSEEIRIIIEI